MKRINKCISCFGIIDSCFNLGKIPLVNNFKSKPQLKKYDLSMALCRKCKLFQIEKNIDPYDVYSADEMFMTGTPFCMLPVTHFNGLKVGSGKRGEVFNKLLNQWSKNTNTDIEKQIKLWNKKDKKDKKNILSPYEFKKK